MVAMERVVAAIFFHSPASSDLCCDSPLYVLIKHER